MTHVDVQRVNATCVITIDRPQALNALNTQVIGELSAAFEGPAREPGVRAVVLTGAGTKAFCAGADLKELADLDAELAHRTMSAGQKVLRDMERAPVPVIAAVNGLALGGGFELALAATFPVLSTNASLGLPESSLGLIPGYGGTQRLPRGVGRRVAAYLMLTGARLGPDRAYDLGLTPVPPVDAGELLDAAISIAEQIAAQGPAAVRAILTALEVAQNGDLDTGLAAETELAARAIAGAESTEGVAAFLERRTPVFPDLEAPA